METCCHLKWCSASDICVGLTDTAQVPRGICVLEHQLQARQNTLGPFMTDASVATMYKWDLHFTSL